MHRTSAGLSSSEKCDSTVLEIGSYIHNYQQFLLQFKELLNVELILKIPIFIFVLIQMALNLIRGSIVSHIDFNARGTYMPPINKWTDILCRSCC